MSACLSVRSFIPEMKHTLSKLVGWMRLNSRKCKFMLGKKMFASNLTSGLKSNAVRDFFKFLTWCTTTLSSHASTQYHSANIHTWIPPDKMSRAISFNVLVFSIWCRNHLLWLPQAKLIFKTIFSIAYDRWHRVSVKARKIQGCLCHPRARRHFQYWK